MQSRLAFTSHLSTVDVLADSLDLQELMPKGVIWATLFGLLMWDVIFMDVPDVFQTAFQTAPLDLGTVVFYRTRKDALEARLSQVREGEGPALLQSCWQQHHGEWCRGVNWDRHGGFATTIQ